MTIDQLSLAVLAPNHDQSDEMPYLLMQKPLGQYVVATETEPPKRDMFKALTAYQDQHLATLPFGAHPLLRQGVRIPEYLFPSSARITQSATKRPPHIVGFGFTGVSMTLKCLIEDLEPEVHQFLEVPFYLKRGEPAPEPYFAMVIGSCIDRYIDFERSTVRRFQRNDGSRYIEGLSPNYPATVVVRSGAVGKRHLWTSLETGAIITVSNRLHDAMLSARIRGFDYFELFAR
jgi:hypothetical protein